MSQGVELEPMGKTYHPPVSTAYAEITNRPKKWDLEQL